MKFILATIVSISLISCSNSDFAGAADAENNKAPSASRGEGDVVVDSDEGVRGDHPDSGEGNQTGNEDGIDIDGVTETEIPLGPARLFGNRLDDPEDMLSIFLKNKNGTWQEMIWPGEGQAVQLEGVCSLDGKPTVLDIKVGNFLIQIGQSKIVHYTSLRRGETSMTVGFEAGAPASKYKSVDDSILSITCDNSNLSLPGISENQSINMDEWVDGLFHKGYTGT
jgi:hypothetical protein